MAWNEPGPGGRDPWGNGSQGGGGGRGPQVPDLEKWLKKLRQKFGGGRGRGPGGGVIGLLIAAIIVIWLLSGFYTVDAQKRGVVMRFGAVVGVAQPGLGWHAPWPIGAVRMVNVTKLRQASTQSTLMTKDHDLVDVGMTVQFRVSSARAYLFNVSDPDGTLAQAAKSILRSVVANYNADAVLGNAQEEIGAKTMQGLQNVLDHYHTGLQVTDVALSNVHPPKQVQKAFADAIKAASDAAKTRNDANAYAQDRLPHAKSQAADEIAQAQAYSDRVVATAHGDKARFDAVLNEYRKAPQATKERLYSETMKQIIRQNRVVLIDRAAGQASVNLSVPPRPAPAPAASVEPPSASSTSSPPVSSHPQPSPRSRQRKGGSR